MVFDTPRGRRRALWLAAILVLTMGASGASGQGRLEATYSASLGGMPIGSGGLTLEIGKRDYQAAGNGHVEGLMRMLSTSAGSVSAQGRLGKDRPSPELYRASVSSGQLDYDVRMVLERGGVKDLIAEPPLLPAADRIPLTEAHRRGIVDPASALLMLVGGNDDLISPKVCDRTIPIFDGHQRFNVQLFYKRADQVRAEVGYAGPALVCGFTYHPIAGHRPGRYAVRYLQEQRDMEISLVPIAGTRVLAPFRIAVPTSLGTAIVEARRFVVSPTANAKLSPVSTRHAIPARTPSGAPGSARTEDSKGSAVNFVTAPASR